MYICQGCGIHFDIVLMLPFELWKKVKGSLSDNSHICGVCIIKRLEEDNYYGTLQVDNVFLKGKN